MLFKSWLNVGIAGFEKHQRGHDGMCFSPAAVAFAEAYPVRPGLKCPLLHHQLAHRQARIRTDVHEIQAGGQRAQFYIRIAGG